MSTVVEKTKQIEPLDAEASVAEFVRAAYAAGEAVYPLGGKTALEYGGVARAGGRVLECAELSRVVDYTPRDMTIVVEAGVRMADLAATLAAEGQQLPIDVPRPKEATIGGVVATNWCGPRRLGHGTIRDYVIGIHAVDGRGVPFKGGGRVVKNVAGYDFCKLLTGSLGTLGVITKLALKVKPRPEREVTVVANCCALSVIENALGRMVNLEASPVAMDLLIGGNWAADRNRLVVRFEGNEEEVAWLAGRATAELAAAGGTDVGRLNDRESDNLWERQVYFADRGAGAEDDGSPFVVQVNVPPSAVASMIGKLVGCDVECTIQSNVASGVIIARFSKFTASDVSLVLVAKLRPAAIQLGGNLVVVRSKLEGLTPHLIWGGRTEATILLERVKAKFDPKGILNPGRYVFGA